MNVPVAVVHGYWCLVGLAGGMSVAGVADGSRVADGTSRCSCIVRARPPLNCSGVVSGAMPPIQSLGMWLVDGLWEDHRFCSHMCVVTCARPIFC